MRVKLIRSNVASNLGVCGTVTFVGDNLHVDWDRDIFHSHIDEEGGDCYILMDKGFVEMDRVKVLDTDKDLNIVGV